MQKFMVVSVKCRQLQGGFAPLTRGVAPGLHWGHSPQTPVVALRFGSTFPSGPPLQISCAPLHWRDNRRTDRQIVHGKI